MFDEPNEVPPEEATDPVGRAREKTDEFRTHAELAAVFEGVRKFEAQLITRFDPDLARDIQHRVGRLEKAKTLNSPVLPEPAVADAAGVLTLPKTRGLSTNDYHVHRRPGEVMIVRWLAGEEVETFYQRLQAHFDAALGSHKEDERQANEWKQDPQATAYLAALDAVKVSMAERYLRDQFAKHGLFVLSTQVADEMNIAYLCDYVMGVAAVDVVGAASAPPADPTEQDLAWFFKRFSLRGSVRGVEHMCVFTYLQKSDDSFDFDA